MEQFKCEVMLHILEKFYGDKVRTTPNEVILTAGDSEYIFKKEDVIYIKHPTQIKEGN